MNNSYGKFILVLVFLFISGISYADQRRINKLTAEEVIKKANQAVFYAGKDARCLVDLKIINDSGRTSEWSFSILRKNTDEDGSQKYFVSFSQPIFLSKLSYMVWKHINQDDQRWIYYPNYNFINSIAEGQQRMRFVGAHFAFEDLTGRAINADQYEMIDYSTGHYFIKGMPVNKESAEFDFYFVWIREKDFIPVKIEFYDENNYLIRLFEVLDIQDIEGHPTIMSTLIKDLKQGGETLVKISEVSYDTGLSEDIFTDQHLRHPDRDFQ